MKIIKLIICIINLIACFTFFKFESIDKKISSIALIIETIGVFILFLI